jgi:predicted phage terminase large subunit-like protein
MEIDRKPEKRFYSPRRHYLLPIVQGYQDVLDGKLRLLTCSLPKRAGKSQLGINFINMLSGKYPDRASLMEGTGEDLVKSFYNGCLEYVQQPNEYLFYDVFPEATLVQTNADMKTINLKTKSRFPTIMCRSIDSRQVGLSEATNVLYLDDCVEGREEAKNRQRLDDKWEVISGDIMGRAIEGTPMVFTGTRYSLYDPIGRIQEYAQREGWAWRAIEIPALDPITDESNYEYEREGKKVFTTAYFREQRELLSAEQFESEFQQQPFEAKGLLFNKKELNYFIKPPVDRDPDAIIAVADTAESGSDSTSMPVAAIYGTEVYIIDVVFDDAPAEVTKPECANCLITNKVGEATFESNNAGVYFARDVAKMCEDRGYMIGIRTKRTVSNKQTRIEFAADTIKKHFFFKDPSTYERGSQYWAFMKEVTTYTRTGKVPHDDAPDSLSLLENEIRGLVGSKVEVMKRPI